MKNIYYIMIFLLGSSTVMIYGQSKLSLHPFYKKEGITSLQRRIAVIDTNNRKVLHVWDAKGEGLAILKDVSFIDGTIELDMKGKDLFQKSFLGIAFNLQKNGTYEVVYFRPFNFRAIDPVRRVHAVQYEYMPGSDWKRLRSSSPGIYEKQVLPSPDPNGWFHVKLVVTAMEVKAYVDYASEPSLVVRRLADSAVGGVALMCGDQSEGYFADLRIANSTQE